MVESTIITLRRDLVFRPQTFADKCCVIVEDPIKSKFYRVGIAEYALISLFDGQTSVAEAMRITASSTSHATVRPQEAVAIAKWLIDTELAVSGESANSNRLTPAASTGRRGRFWRHWNPLRMRLPLGNPDRLFDAVTPWLGWLFSRSALAVWIVILLMAASQAAAHWSRLVACASEVCVPDNWLWLGGCWIVLKFIHETAHGVACKKRGGAVREAGLMLILFTPIAYVDVTSSWRFRSKWQRIQTAAAGIYIELLIAAVAVLLWSGTSPGLINYIAINVAIMASVTTLIFNANPLMRFDGYYMLADWLEMPNLYSTSQSYLRNLSNRYFLGMDAPAPNWLRGRGMFLRLYAWAALAWRFVMLAGLFCVVTAMFHGAGIVLAVGALAVWCATFSAQLVRHHARGHFRQTYRWPRIVVTIALPMGVAAVLGWVLPWPAATQAPAVVTYSPMTIVRSGCPGFVRDLRVQDGQLVKQGQVLVVLQNDQLEFELTDIRLALQQSQLLGRISETSMKVTESQAHQETVKVLRKRIGEKQAQVEQLSIRAPRNGTIIGRGIDALIGTYLHQGDEILTIGDEAQKQLHISVAQEDFDTFSSRIGELVQVRVFGSDAGQSRFVSLEPRASVHVEHLSLSAATGGPLPARCDNSHVDRQPRRADRCEFLSPRFAGTVELSAAQSRQARCGQLATVSFRSSHETLGVHLYSLVAKWIEGKLQRTFRR